MFFVLTTLLAHLLSFVSLFQVNLNDEDPNLQELLQAGRGGILIEDFVKYSLDMKLLDVQVSQNGLLQFSTNFLCSQPLCWITGNIYLF